MISFTALLCFRTPVNVVVGAPIHTERIPEPSQEDIDRVHAAYVSGVQKLYDDYKDEYGNPNVTLDIHYSSKTT